MPSPAGTRRSTRSTCHRSHPCSEGPADDAVVRPGPGPTASRPYVLPSDYTNHNCPYCPAGLFHVQTQQDEKAFIAAAISSSSKTCDLRQVSFVKPLGEENECPRTRIPALVVAPHLH